ncbi:MAG TPA: FAD-dependent oxidoreductase [Mucilaginibacter sp.]|jgi:hypothetical protein|nr:FAD-dependent oxidoreductase [Mucilaginibacter sp.]
MIKKLLFLLFFSLVYRANAQTIKTDVLVIGGSPSGVAAAIQSARSKVKTILVAENIRLSDEAPANETLRLQPYIDRSSGIWAEFRTRLRAYYKIQADKDTVYNATLRFERRVGDTLLKKMTDTVKNLKVYLDASLTTLKKDGDGWELTVTQNRKTFNIKVKVIIDATEAGEIVEKAGLKFSGRVELFNQNTHTALYRTAIAAGENLPIDGYPPDTYWYLPMNAVLPAGANNLLVTENVMPGRKTVDYLPLQLATGQGVGAMAAYCAFFKTDTKNLRVRIIQGELLDFKEILAPYADIDENDRDWRSIQQVCLTGLLKCSGKSGHFNFGPDANVTTAEIKPVLQEIYTRAFLWFNREKPGEKFTIANTLSFISDYTLTDPAILKAAIQKAWKTQFKFKSDFDSNRPITRREFAVLANKYLNPFARTVDLSGQLVN